MRIRFRDAPFAGGCASSPGARRLRAGGRAASGRDACGNEFQIVSQYFTEFAALRGARPKERPKW